MADKYITSKKGKVVTLEHSEFLDDLMQMDDAMAQDLDEAVRLRTEELLEEIGIDDDDIIAYDSSINVQISIKYKKGKKHEKN